jgi:ribosomal protein S18 acetylase RimI-like enzyme
MQLRPTTIDDYDAIVRVTSEARAHLAAQGSDQWGSGHPHPELIREDIQLGHSFVAVDECDTVLGTFALCGEGERDYANVLQGSWLTSSPNGWDDGPVTYAVVHRVAVGDDARDQGVATFMMASSLELAQMRGFKSVRVDTHHKNAAMQHVFQKVGFSRCCEIIITSILEPTKERVGFETLV